MKRINFLSLVLATVFIWSCSPKTTPTTTTTPKEQPTTVVPPKPQETLPEESTCKKFSDAPVYDEAKKNYVLYRDFLNAEEWEQAYSYWKKVYRDSPAADGKRSTVYFDGITFFENFLAEETDETKRKEYINSILELYDEAARCYPKEEYEVMAYKAFDLYYNYAGYASEEEVFKMIKKIVDKEGNKTPAFIFNAFADLLVNLHIDKKITTEEAKKYSDKMDAILEYNLKNCKDEDCADWIALEAYKPSVMDYFENIDGFYDCSYFVTKYYKPMVKGQTDCTEAKEILYYLKKGKCAEAQPEYAEVKAFVQENCVEKGNLRQAYEEFEKGNYKEAIGFFEAYINDPKTPVERKAKYQMVVAKLYYGQVRNFRKSREYARAAAKNRPNWGEPYLLIGRLYASSGPLCGPGRGWDSQIVVWPAIDKWNKAIKVDPSSAKEARRMINKYAKFMPSKGDLHQRVLKEGQTFKVGCWIQEATIIRAAK